MKITTLEQLEALPVGSVIKELGKYGSVYPKDHEGWEFDNCCNRHFSDDEIELPVTLLIPATITQEQFEKAAKAVREAEWFGTGYEQAYAALAAIGISVEGEDE